MFGASIGWRKQAEDKINRQIVDSLQIDRLGKPRKHCNNVSESVNLAVRDCNALAKAGRTEPLVDLIDELRANGVRTVSPNGVLGDPRSATANHGKALLTRLTIDLVAAVDEWRA